MRKSGEDSYIIPQEDLNSDRHTQRRERMGGRGTGEEREQRKRYVVKQEGPTSEFQTDT